MLSLPVHFAIRKNCLCLCSECWLSSWHLVSCNNGTERKESHRLFQHVLHLLNMPEHIFSVLIHLPPWSSKLCNPWLITHLFATFPGFTLTKLHWSAGLTQKTSSIKPQKCWIHSKLSENALCHPKLAFFSSDVIVGEENAAPIFSCNLRGIFCTQSSSWGLHYSSDFHGFFLPKFCNTLEDVRRALLLCTN